MSVLSYLDFQEQADQYRYTLAQTMNELQMALISPKKESGSEGKIHVIGQEHWEEFTDFTHHPIAFSTSFQKAFLPLVSLVLWTFAAYGLLIVTSKSASAL